MGNLLVTLRRKIDKKIIEAFSVNMELSLMEEDIQGITSSYTKSSKKERDSQDVALTGKKSVSRL